MIAWGKEFVKGDKKIFSFFQTPLQIAFEYGIIIWILFVTNLFFGGISMPKYEALSPEITARIQQDRENGISTGMAFPSEAVIRRQTIAKDKGSVWRPTFVHDIDKIMHCPFYNR